jgi:hypothetical protein
MEKSSLLRTWAWSLVNTFFRGTLSCSSNDQFAQPCPILIDADVVIVGGMRQTIWQAQQVTLERANDSRPYRVIRL